MRPLKIKDFLNFIMSHTCEREESKIAGLATARQTHAMLGLKEHHRVEPLIILT